MSELNSYNTADDCIQFFALDGCTYEIRSFFGSKIRLEDIMAQRALKDINNENEEETTCLSVAEERSYPVK